MPLNPLSRSYIPTGRIHPASVEPAEVFDAQPSPISPQQLRMLDELLSQWIVQLSEEEDVMFGHQVRKRIFEEILVHGGTEITIDYPGQTPTLPGFTIKNSFDFDRRTSLLAAPLPDSTRLASTHHESLLHEAHWWVIAVMANSALSAIEQLKQIHGYLELLDRSAKDAARDGDPVGASARAVLRVVAVERFERKVNSSVQAIGEDAEPLMRSIREFGEWPEVVERCPLSGREQKPSQNLGSTLPAAGSTVRAGRS